MLYGKAQRILSRPKRTDSVDQRRREEEAMEKKRRRLHFRNERREAKKKAQELESGRGEGNLTEDNRGGDGHCEVPRDE
jgi:hypothetical protein